MQRSAMPQHDPQLRGGRAATPACSSSSRSASSIRRLAARAMPPACTHGKLLALVRHQSQQLKDQASACGPRSVPCKWVHCYRGCHADQHPMSSMLQPRQLCKSEGGLTVVLLLRG